MEPQFTSLDDLKYKRFKDHVNSFKQTRYYIIDFVSIVNLRNKGVSTDDIADVTSEYFDDHEWPIRKDPTIAVPDHWPTVDEQWAERHIIEQLCGGPEFGHRDYAMSPEEAQKIWSEFLHFFDADRTLYGVNLGDPKWVFQSGILIVDKDKAGVLNVVQSD